MLIQSILQAVGVELRFLVSRRDSLVGMRTFGFEMQVEAISDQSVN